MPVEVVTRRGARPGRSCAEQTVGPVVEAVAGNAVYSVEAVRRPAGHGDCVGAAATGPARSTVRHRTCPTESVRRCPAR